ncbi:hypothetical protein QVD17_10834 [Tagetes erecta]|uniref:Uncharacterized protein n=1 Tax=Tagetes erecta TaxID=13708 RepID=A0AAD8L737_TARER|nr:hypothetical protein QVD17_10834 [Tagetes erecta]
MTKRSYTSWQTVKIKRTAHSTMALYQVLIATCQEDPNSNKHDLFGVLFSSRSINPIHPKIDTTVGGCELPLLAYKNIPCLFTNIKKVQTLSIDQNEVVNSTPFLTRTRYDVFRPANHHPFVRKNISPDHITLIINHTNTSSTSKTKP